jgi:hypothetical protein
MSMARRWVTMAAVMVILAAQAVRAYAADGDSEITMQRALDQPVTLLLQNVSLAEAFRQIKATAKIPILQIDQECYDLLPYGDTTRVSVDFRQSKLREGLDVLLSPLGLQMTIAGATVMIRPTNPLKHIGRRADWEELKLLVELSKSVDVKMPASGPFNLTAGIKAAMEGRTDLQVVITAEAGGQDAALQQIAKQLPMSAYRVLELYCQLTNTLWFVESGGPTGGRITVMTPRQWIGRQLERPIQLSRKDEPLEVIVADLAHASGIRFVPEPGLYQSVPVVSLRSDNGTVLQTLEALAGVTRIAFEVRDDSVLLLLSPGPGNQGRGEAIVGRISVPVGTGADGGMMDVYIRESDLTPEQNQLRKKKIEEAVKAMQKAWTTPAATAATGGAPASGTATGTLPKGE